MGSSTTRTEPWGAQKDYLERGFRSAGTQLDRGLPDYYGKDWTDTLAGFSPEQVASQDAMLNYMRSPEVAALQQGTSQQYLDTFGLTKGMTDTASDLAAGIAPGAFTPAQRQSLLAGEVNTGPFANVVRDMSQDVLGAIQSEILPNIRQQQVQYQPGGSSRGDMVASDAVSSAIDRLTKQSTQMYADEFTRAQDRRLPAAQYQTGTAQGAANYLTGAQQAAGQLGIQNMGQYQNIMNAPVGLMQLGSNIGAQRRAMDQAQINENMKRYNYESMRPQAELQNYMSSISGDYGGQSTATPSGMSQAGTMMALMKMASTMSDIRVKENISVIGHLKMLPVYLFNYIWSPERHIGFMAQDVEEVMPEAVGEIYGIKTVNYPMVLGRLV